MQGQVLVTGASGFIGRDLVQRLALAGWQVRAAARDMPGVLRPSGVEVVRLPDLAVPADWVPLVDGVSHVVHLAGIAHATSAIPDSAYHAVNAEAVRTLARAARNAGVARVVMMSSIRAQCGASANSIVDERRAPEPIDSYGRSKLAGERYLADALTEGPTDWCALRPVVVYGPEVKGNMATLQRLARTGWPLPLGGFSARRSLLGLANLASAVEHVMLSPAASRGTFLLADPGPLRVPEIVATLRRGMGTAPRILHVPLAPVRIAATLTGRLAIWERIAGDLVASTSALEQTGWHPLETAAEGLRRWMLDNVGTAGR